MNKSKSKINNNEALEKERSDKMLEKAQDELVIHHLKEDVDEAIFEGLDDD